MLLVCRDLRSAEDGGQSLERDTHHVVLWLLRGERGASGLRVEAQLPTGGLLRLEAFAHDLRPHPARGAELGDLFEQVIVRVEEERELPAQSRPRLSPAVSAAST